MNETMDFRAVKLNEIMNETELLNFNYKAARKSFAITSLHRLAAILFFAAAIITMQPL